MFEKPKAPFWGFCGRLFQTNFLYQGVVTLFTLALEVV